jgi:hypothetical protein
VGSLFGEETEEEGGELLDDYTVAQLSARRRSNLGRIVEARPAEPVFFSFSPYNVFLCSGWAPFCCRFGSGSDFLS